MKAINTLEEFNRTFPKQYNLYYPDKLNSQAGNYDLYMRILPEPVSRIFKGDKKYELRKYVPQHTGLVFLFETGKINAVTGCFYFREYISDSIDKLWETVNHLATKKENYDKYFASKKFGVALEIMDYEKFAKPIILDTITSRFPDFPKVPEPYVYLYTPVGSDLSKLLRSHTAEILQRNELAG